MSSDRSSDVVRDFHRAREIPRRFTFTRRTAMSPSGTRLSAFLIVVAFAGQCWAAPAHPVVPEVPGPNNAITDVPGITVGHWTGTESGATIVLAGGPTGAGVAGGVTQ